MANSTEKARPTVYTIKAIHVHQSPRASCKYGSKGVITGYMWEMRAASAAATDRKNDFQVGVVPLQLREGLDATLCSIDFDLSVRKLVAQLRR